jgi:hypothetical protein
MADIFSPASIDPSSRGSLPGTVRLILTKFLAEVDDMLPARVLAYDRASNRARVQSLINMVTTNGIRVPRGTIASVPVLQLGGGGFVASFPISEGDIGWIKANDRDISVFMQSFANSDPNTQRKHSFEDALFIPDTMMQSVSIAEEDENNLVIQNLAGTVKISWWASLLKILTPRMTITDTTAFIGDENVIVDIQSTTKAFRLPRMTTAQRNAIPDPKEGMIIWNLTTHGLNSYNGSTWG